MDNRTVRTFTNADDPEKYQTLALLLSLCYFGAAWFWTIGTSAQQVRIACDGVGDDAYNNTPTAQGRATVPPYWPLPYSKLA